MSGIRKTVLVIAVFASLFSPLAVGAQTLQLNRLLSTGTAPTLAGFSVSPIASGKAHVSVQISHIGDKASSITACDFSSTRPAVRAGLAIAQPDSSHPDMYFCEGDVDFGAVTTPYLPAVSVIVTNDLNLSTTATAPESVVAVPVIDSPTLNDNKGAAITVGNDFTGDIHGAVHIADAAGNKDCTIALSAPVATVGNIVNHYDGCTFDFTAITASFSATLTSTNLIGAISAPLTFTVTKSAPVAVVSPEQPTQPPVAQTDAHLIADYSVTQGKAIVAEKVLPDTTQAKNLVRASISFWVALALIVIALALFILLLWKRRKKQYWLQYLFVGGVAFVGVIGLLFARFSIEASKPQYIDHPTFSAAAVPTNKTVATELVAVTKEASSKKNDATSTDAAKNQVPGSTVEPLKPLVKFPEYIGRFGQFIATVDDAKTSLNLQTKVAEGSDAPVWGMESAVTENTDYIKTFQLTATGTAPGNVVVEVSTFPFPGQNCLKSTAIYTMPLSANQLVTTFNLDFKKIIPAAYLNGKQSGTLPFSVRVVRTATNENCNDLVSNAVSTSAVFVLTSQTVTYPDSATKAVLYTTRDSQRTGGEFPNIDDIAALDWKAANQTYRFVMDEPKNSYPAFGRWQVSLSPFDDAQCLGPDDQIAFADVDLSATAPRQLAFAIDFSKIAINKPSTKGNFEEVKPAAWQNIPLQFFAKKGSGLTKTSLEQQLANSKDPVKYYVRFVALDAGAGTCNTNFKPTNTVTIRYGDVSTATGKPFTLPITAQHPVEIQASLGVVSVKYTPPRQDIDYFNPEGHYYWLKDFPDTVSIPPVYHKGDKIYIPPVQPQQDKSFLDSVGDFVSSVGDFISSIGDLVSAVADAYNGIKAGVVDGIASGLSAVGVPCDSTCKAALSAGISIAQSAIGIPPSLPNFDQLVDGGIDYIAAAAADQVADGAGTAVSAATEQATKAGLVAMKDQLKQARAAADASAPSPIAPDPDYMYRPGSITVTVKNLSTVPARGQLTVNFTDTNNLPNADLKQRKMFVTSYVPVPTLAPGQVMSIPIQLQENYDDYKSFEGDVPPGYTCNSKSGSCAGIVSDPAYALTVRKGRWMDVFNNQKVNMDVFAGAPIKLPSGFKPEDVGVDATGWALQPGSGATSQKWFDEATNTNHIFTAKAIGGQTVNVTFAPHNAYSN